MAKVTIEYKKYGISKLATAISFVGGLLSTLTILPGVFLFAASFAGLFTNGITNLESWGTLGASILVAAVCVGISMVIKFIFEWLASLVAKSKMKRLLKKRGINV